MTEVVEVLAAWLTAIWDEGERLAKGCVDDIGGHRAGDPLSDGSGEADCDAFPSYPWGSDGWERAYMAGPAQPSAVLARIVADRQILTECIIVLEGKEPGRMRERVLAWTILRLLASAHRDRPGWQEAWQ